MGDRGRAALTLWECLDGRQRGRLASKLKLKESSITPSPPPSGDLTRHGVPGYVDVGIAQSTAQATLAVDWKIGADAWKRAKDEGASLYVCLHSHHPSDEHDENATNDANKHDLCRLPVDSAQGTAQFPAATLTQNGSLRSGFEARLLKVIQAKNPKKTLGETSPTTAGRSLNNTGDDLPSDADLTVMAKSEIVNVVSGTLERTWSMQLEKVSIVLNTSAIPLTPPKAHVSMAAPVRLSREPDLQDLQSQRNEYEEISWEEREALFKSVWRSLSAVERTMLRPHLTASNRGREIIPERGHGNGNVETSTSKRTLRAEKLKSKKEKAKTKAKAKAKANVTMSEAEETTELMKKDRSAKNATVLIPSTAGRLDDDDNDDEGTDADVADGWVMLALGEDEKTRVGEPTVNLEDVLSTVSLSFVDVSFSIQPSVVWNLTATEYYDWIGIVDAETDETVAKVSINSLVSWTNPVGAHAWSEALTTLAQKKGLTKKYYAVMWRWHEEANQYHALGYSSNIIRTVVSMQRRELVRQNLTATAEHMSAVYKEESLFCAQLACAAYQCYDGLQGSLPPPLEVVYKIDNKRTDTQGFMSLDKKGGVAYVAFKGSWEMTDFMNDADLFLGPFVEQPPLKAQAMMVECWNSVKDPLLDQLLKYLKAKTISKVTITGHSLGAALACMMMEWILHDSRFDAYKFGTSDLKLYTFACPRSFDWAANADSIKQLDKYRAMMLSFVDKNDPVATGAWGFLKYFGYYHVGSVVLLEGSGHAMSNYINLIKAL